MSDGKAFFRRLTIGLSLVLSLLTGCAAFHPMKGIPARYVPDELKVGQRTGKRTIDLSLLSQDWDRIHRVDSGDLLGIYISDVLGKKYEIPQVLIPQNSDYPPAAGVPISVREDGTISLPMIGSLSVRGKTIRETEEAIRAAYEKSSKGENFINGKDSRILVSLQRPRQTRVLIVRQDSRNEPMANSAINLLNIGTTKRGTGKVVSLPAYSNDVLNALIASDGLPGLDAENAVYIIRRTKKMPPGQDPIWSGAIDPAELIRQSRAEEEPVIRGQNWETFESRENGTSSNSVLFGDQNFQPQGPVGGPQSTFGAIQTSHFPTPLANPGQQTSPQQNIGQPPAQQQDSYQQTYSGQYPSSNQAQYPNQPPYAGQQPYPGQQQYLNRQQYPVPQQPNGQQQYSAQQLTPTPDPNAYRSQSGVPPAPDPLGQQGWQQPQHSFVNPQFDGTGMPEPGYSIPDQGFPGQDSGVPQGSHGNSLDDNQQSGNRVTYSPGAKEGTQIIRIPIRLGPGEHIDIKKEDVILHDGDIIFIESRDTEVFFTGGLLGAGSTHSLEILIWTSCRHCQLPDHVKGRPVPRGQSVVFPR